MAVGMGEGVQGVVGVHAEFVAGDENGAAGAQADVAAAVLDGAGAHSRGGVVARARDHLHIFRQAPGLGGLGGQIAHHLIALIEPGQLAFAHAADIQHLPGPALMLHVQQQNAAGVAVIAAMDAGEAIVDVVLGQHDLADAGEVFRLVFAHPQELGRGEAREGDVGGVFGDLLFADLLVEIGHLFFGAPVVPQDGGADDLILVVQHHQAVHLAAAADARHAAGVIACQQGVDALGAGPPPFGGLLLAPAGLRENQRIFPGFAAQDPALFVHQQQLHRRGAQIDADIQFGIRHFCILLPIK